MNNARDQHEYLHKWGKTGPSLLLSGNGNLSFLLLSFRNSPLERTFKESFKNIRRQLLFLMNHFYYGLSASVQRPSQAVHCWTCTLLDICTYAVPFSNFWFLEMFTSHVFLRGTLCSVYRRTFHQGRAVRLIFLWFRCYCMYLLAIYQLTLRYFGIYFFAFFSVF